MTSDTQNQSLDDVIVAMDVVDTLRHRDLIIQKELDRGGQAEQLIDRLREIYAAQGIDVPDEILREGVEALGEQRFTYKPPRPSLSVLLAKIYVSRRKWIPPIRLGLILLAIGWAIWHFGIVERGKAQERRIATAIEETLPPQLEAIYRETRDLANGARAKEMADAYYRAGQTALEDRDVKGTRAAIEDIEDLRDDLTITYEVRVVYGPGEGRSGVFRVPNDAPDQRNYYLIVEAIDPTGDRVRVEIESEEDRTTRRVTRWGQRVSERVYNRVGADKQDDQIIQNNVIGRKSVGDLAPVYTVETPGGAILEW